MKRLVLLALVILAVVVAVFLSNLRNLGDLSQKKGVGQDEKKAILRVALVADSHNENELLAKALTQAKGMGINFVIGVGDYTNLGTVDELTVAKNEFEKSKLEYFLIPGDRDGWESRERGEVDPTNFIEVFGPLSQVLEREGVKFVLVDNSDLYKGISKEDWKKLNSDLSDLSNLGDLSQKRLVFVFAHKTPFHPESSHVMGEDSEEVSRQARKLMDLLEEGKVDGFFSGDLHFFASYLSPSKIVKMTTVGAAASDRNFQGPRFAILTVFDDYSWEVEDVEIR